MVPPCEMEGKSRGCLLLHMLLLLCSSCCPTTLDDVFDIVKTFNNINLTTHMVPYLIDILIKIALPYIFTFMFTAAALILLVPHRLLARAIWFALPSPFKIIFKMTYSTVMLIANSLWGLLHKLCKPKLDNRSR